MGVLDDAIREHLDLKRRRGADPDEVERAEREALGPVRRSPEPGTDDALELGHDGLEDADVRDPEWSEDWEPESELTAPAAGGADPVGAPPLTPSPDEPRMGSDRLSASPSRPEPNSPEPFDHGDATAEFDVERALGKTPEEEGEDVLEETPDFLQDTPDHDRLWFEQRPPRDFDFDG